jgi:flagellar basal-body rod protein FlgG
MVHAAALKPGRRQPINRGGEQQMVRGIYTAAGGMLTIEEQTATTANNLANVNTTGFKQDLLLFTSAPGIHTWRVYDPSTADARGVSQPEYIGLQNAGVLDTVIFRDFSQGQLVQTGRNLDVALVGDGFFRVVDPASGEELYTRDGSFVQTPDGYLVDQSGRRVQGAGGDINLGGSNDVYYAQTGEIFAANAQLGAFSLAYFDDPQTALSKAGDNAFRAENGPDSTGTAGPDGMTQFQGGYLERSNVDPVRSIVELISQQRHYEAAQRAVTTHDAALDIAANQIGRMPQ